MGIKMRIFICVWLWFIYLWHELTLWLVTDMPVSTPSAFNLIASNLSCLWTFINDWTPFQKREFLDDASRDLFFLIEFKLGCFTAPWSDFGTSCGPLLLYDDLWKDSILRLEDTANKLSYGGNWVFCSIECDADLRSLIYYSKNAAVVHRTRYAACFGGHRLQRISRHVRLRRDVEELTVGWSSELYGVNSNIITEKWKAYGLRNGWHVHVNRVNTQVRFPQSQSHSALSRDLDFD